MNSEGQGWTGPKRHSAVRTTGASTFMHRFSAREIPSNQVAQPTHSSSLKKAKQPNDLVLWSLKGDYSRIWSHESLEVHGCFLIEESIFLYRARGNSFHSQGWLNMATFQRNTWRRQQGIHVPELCLVTNGSDAAGREDFFRDQNQDTFMPCLHTQRDSAA